MGLRKTTCWALEKIASPLCILNEYNHSQVPISGHNEARIDFNAL